jgi:hypothetical protein
MKSTRIDYEENSKIFLLDNFFSHELIEHIATIFDNITDPAWASSQIFEHRAGRLMYSENNTIIDQIRNFASSTGVIDALSTLIQSTVKFDSVNLWADFEGYEITPHTDPDYFKYAIQIYVSREKFHWNTPMFGTTIYSAQQLPLLQLPYRNNFGYFFEKPHKVCHGLGTAVPAGMQRNSVYLRYNS